jgi:hypothetical protein
MADRSGEREYTDFKRKAAECVRQFEVNKAEY